MGFIFGHDDGNVKPTKFKSIDNEFESSEDHFDQRTKTTMKTCPKNSQAKDKIMRQKPNFLLGYSFPAVVFDRVCFSVDKSQQQSRFILNDCFNYLKSLTNSEEQLLNQRVEILKSICLNVPYGSIFGLLGPSSCGKTTLLRCLVGLLKPSSGAISLFGCNLDNGEQKSGCFQGGCSLGDIKNRLKRTDESRVLGQSIGYMPQDLGLYEDFTIEQLLTMFGRYVRMETELIKERIDFMTEFLDLPEKERQISTLSGGQKRRVSFAIACLHMPPLIILDEPTVGVDPLLRKSIWRYLRKLATEENKTIIITTHYIEEAAQADQVALMRAGEILIQDKPVKIMKDYNCRTLEEAFLRICNNVQPDLQCGTAESLKSRIDAVKIYPQPRFVWPVNSIVNLKMVPTAECKVQGWPMTIDTSTRNKILKLEARENSALVDEVRVKRKDSNSSISYKSSTSRSITYTNTIHGPLFNQLSMSPNRDNVRESNFKDFKCDKFDLHLRQTRASAGQVDNHLSEMNQNCVKDNTRKHRKKKALKVLRANKFVVDHNCNDAASAQTGNINLSRDDLLVSNQSIVPDSSQMMNQFRSNVFILWALLYKNYRRNINSIPLVAFQFLLPLIQMISFSLCVGGRPTDIGLGLVNLDHLSSATMIATERVPGSLLSNVSSIVMLNTDHPDSSSVSLDDDLDESELLSLKYLSYIDTSMISIHKYDSLDEAIEDVRRVKLWAVMEIGENFTNTVSQRYDLENFYQLDRETTQQSIIKLYPDRSNKILDMICQRSLAESYRKFLLNHFDHFKRLPVEVKEPIFDIKPNIISNSIDGYTESIAPGLLASLTYIMAAGLTTFIMVVERSDGILERTYTSGINPVLYLLAHAMFRSLMMMLQIAAVLVLTFYILKQPIVGSVWLAYFMLMTLNMTGISYGLLISSLVVDQNGAALTIVGSLVVKITLSGILWPFEAIPRWLRMICYVQPLTMPVQALKAITLKGATIGERSVYMGFIVAVSWMIVFLYISAKRFKFYQH